VAEGKKESKKERNCCLGWMREKEEEGTFVKREWAASEVP
jgi:hypothetical protein